MSATLPIVNRQPELIEQLLGEQSQLTAVEQFSQWHSDQHEPVRGPAQEKYYRHLLPASPPGPAEQFAFEVDLNACSGCKACVVACHTMNGLEEQESWRRVGTLLIGQQDDPSAQSAIQHITTACHHCEDPGCLNGCPVKAYDKDPITGIVRHLDDQCIGCKYCTMMCPYEVPQYSDRLGIVRKCDMCHQRLSVGEAPACVQACPNEAIRITIVSNKQAEIDEALVPSAPKSSITRPTTIYAGQYELQSTSTSPQDENIDQVAESHWPLALMLVATQISVGILIAETLASLSVSVLGVATPPSLPVIAALTAFVVGNLGLAIAPLHLGQPLRMWRVFLGLRTSWLSREAVVLGKYMGILFVAMVLMLLSIDDGQRTESIRKWIPFWAGRATVIVAAITGVVGLYCSAMIYIATQRNLWRSGRTLPRFFATALSVGCLVVAAVNALMGVGVVASALGLIGSSIALWKWSWLRKIAAMQSTDCDDDDCRSNRLIRECLGETQRMYDFGTVVAVALAVIACLLSLRLSVVGGSLFVSSVFLLSIAEYLERRLYFQSVVFDRMPGTL